MTSKQDSSNESAAAPSPIRTGGAAAKQTSSASKPPNEQRKSRAAVVESAAEPDPSAPRKSRFAVFQRDESDGEAKEPSEGDGSFTKSSSSDSMTDSKLKDQLKIEEHLTGLEEHCAHLQAKAKSKGTFDTDQLNVDPAVKKQIDTDIPQLSLAQAVDFSNKVGFNSGATKKPPNFERELQSTLSILLPNAPVKEALTGDLNGYLADNGCSQFLPSGIAQHGEKKTTSKVMAQVFAKMTVNPDTVGIKDSKAKSSTRLDSDAPDEIVQASLEVLDPVITAINDGQIEVNQRHMQEMYRWCRTQLVITQFLTFLIDHLCRAVKDSDKLTKPVNNQLIALLRNIKSMAASGHDLADKRVLPTIPVVICHMLNWNVSSASSLYNQLVQCFDLNIAAFLDTGKPLLSFAALNGEGIRGMVQRLIRLVETNSSASTDLSGLNSKETNPFQNEVLIAYIFFNALKLAQFPDAASSSAAAQQFSNFLLDPTSFSVKRLVHIADSLEKNSLCRSTVVVAHAKELKNDPRDDSKPKRKVRQDDDEPFSFAADGDQKPSNAMTSPEFRKRFEKYDLYEMEPTRENWIKASNWCAQFGIEEYGDRFPKLEKSVDPFSEDGAGVIFKFPRLSKDTFAQLMKKLKQNESEADSKTAKDKFNCLRNIKFIRQYSLISSGAARKGKWGDIIHNAKKFVKEEDSATSMVGLGRSSSFNSAPSSSQGARLSKKTKAQTFKANGDDTDLLDAVHARLESRQVSKAARKKLASALVGLDRDDLANLDMDGNESSGFDIQFGIGSDR